MEESRRSALMQLEPLDKLEWKEEGRERNAIRAAKRAAEVHNIVFSSLRSMLNENNTFKNKSNLIICK